MGDIVTTIENLLKSHGISGAKMCLDLGMSKSFLTELRKGRAKSVKAETAQKIADYFGVTVEYLLGKEEKPTVTDGQKEAPDQLVLTGSEINLVKLFRQFPQVQQESIVLMVEKFHTVPADKRESALQTLQALLNMLQTP